MSLAWLFLGGFLFGLGFLSGSWVYAFPFAILALAMSWLTRNSISVFEKKALVPVDETPDLRSNFLKQGTEGAKSADAEESMPSREKRKAAIRKLEDTIDLNLLDALSVLKESIEAHSLCIFFPGRNEGLYLRVWTTEADSVIPGARIAMGQGLVGQLLKEGVRRVLEGDVITDSRQLYYYNDNEKVRSIAGVPIIVEDIRRGAVLIDSLKAKAFDTKTIQHLENFSNVVGHLVYHAYMEFENGFQKDQLVALANYQRKFLENMSEKEIVKYVHQYMEQAVEGERHMLLARKEFGSDEAEVLNVSGLDTDFYQGFVFRISEKGIVSLAFEKNQIVNRRFSRGDVIPRLSPREKSNDQFRSLLAVPVFTDRGTQMVLVVESNRLPWYSDHQKQMLMTIARAAGFSLSRAWLYEEKSQLASRDGLTGLNNHRSFQEQFKNELMRAQRYSYKVAVLMLDIDYFKKVNDSYGHPVGDVVLREVAKLILQSVRQGSDQLARYGGEEFVCMLVDTDITKASETAERIRSSVAAKSYDIGNGQVIQVTLSIGGALFPDDAKYGKELLELADKSLYKAKESGRNRAIFYH